MDVYEAIHTRRDVEAFGDACPSREVIERLIEAARWAPNHRMTQPWRFHVFTGAARDEFADAIASWLASNGQPESLGTSARAKLNRAPVALFLTQAGTPDDAARDLEDYAACACALQNLLLAAEAEGLAAHTSTDRLITYDVTREQLGLTGGDRVVAIVHLGFLREGTPAKVGKRDEPIVQWDWRA